MENNMQRNDSSINCISQPKHLSFYEENYILEPEDYNRDNGYFQYESDESIVYPDEISIRQN